MSANQNQTEPKFINGLKASHKHVKTIFGKITERNVTFCIDISGSMHQFYQHIREHLIDALIQLSENRNNKFNVIIFNSSVYEFSKKHERCTVEKIRLFIQWLENTSYESKSDLLGGIIKSFECNPDVVYLVSDGYSNHERRDIFQNLLHITKGRPIKCILVTEECPPNEFAVSLLERIALETNGTLTIVKYTNNGCLEVIQPIYFTNQPHSHTRHKYLNNYQLPTGKKFDGDFIGFEEDNDDICLKNDPMEDPPLVAPFIAKDPLSGKLCPFYHPFNHWYWPQYWQNKGTGPFCPWVKFDAQYHCMKKKFRKSRAFIGAKRYLKKFYETPCNYPTSAALMMNRTILSISKSHDGKLLRGTVIGQCQDDIFKVLYDCDREYNIVHNVDVHELIDLEEMKRHKIVPGDFVLLPIEKDDAECQGVYGFGKVIQGTEYRAQRYDVLEVSSNELVIELIIDKQQVTLSANKAAYISEILKRRLEKKMEHTKSRPDYTSTETSKTPAEIEYELSNFDDGEDDYDDDDEEEEGEVKTNKPNINMANQFCCCNTHCFNNTHPIIGGVPKEPISKEEEGMSLEELEQKIKELKNLENEAEKTEKNKNDDTELDSEEENDNEEYEDKWKDSLYETSRKDSNNNCLELVSNTSYLEKYLKKDAMTETDVNWALLSIMSKQEKDKLNMKLKNKQQQPWRYWGRKSIPDVIDPPSTEPYQDPHNWGCLMPKEPTGSLEWPSVVLNRVEAHSVTNSISPDRMFQMIRNNDLKSRYNFSSPIRTRDAQVGDFSAFTAPELRERQWNQNIRHFTGSGLAERPRNPYYDNVQPILASWSDIGRTRLSRPQQATRSLERSRIEAQISRDEANLRNYVRYKAEIPTKVAMVQT